MGRLTACWGLGGLLSVSFGCHAPVSARTPEVEVASWALAELEPGGKSDSLSVRRVGHAAQALELMPSGIDWAMSVDLSQFAERPQVRERIFRSMTGARDWSEALSLLHSCGYQLEDLDRVSVGGRFAPSEGPGERELVVVLEGPQLASEKRLQCVHEERSRKKGSGLRLDDRGAFVRISRAHGADEGPMVYAVGEGQVVLAEGAESQAVEGVLRGVALSAKQGQLAGPLAYTDLGAAMFWLGHLEGMSTAAGGAQDPFAEARSVSMGVRLAPGGGLSIDGRIAMPTETLARSASDYLAREFEQVKPLAGMFGVSAESVDAVDFTSAGTLATVFVPLNLGDVDRLLTTIEASTVSHTSPTNNYP